MSEYLPKEIREQLAAAVAKGKRKRATRAVHIGDEAFAILEMSEHGFSVEAESTPRLRGLIDIYEGAHHAYRALIIAASRDGAMMRYDFKRNTSAMQQAPVDFEISAPRPTGLLSRA